MQDLNQLEVILVNPRNAENIGAVARVMANFGATHLSLVSPWDPTWQQARTAVHAEELLLNARITETLPAAIGNCHLVLGTGTLNRREPTQQALTLPQASGVVHSALGAGQRVALVLGSEKHGLTREHLSYCHAILEIPTHPAQPSMNLSHAAAVCLYELSRTTDLTPPPALRSANPPTSSHLDRLASCILEVAQQSGYSPASMAAANAEDTHILLRSLSLTPHDTQRAMRLFRRILWKLRH